MEERAVIRYCEAPDGARLACQLLGERPLNILWPGGDGPPVDIKLEYPGFLKCAKRLCRFGRVAFCDARGSGASGGNLVDRYCDDVVTADFLAWLDALGFEQAVLVGHREIGAPTIRFATEHPERVRALVLIDTFAHYIREPGYPVGFPKETLDKYLAGILDQWGTRAMSEGLMPSMDGDAAFHDRMARHERLGGSPAHAAEAARLAWQQDVRSVLGEVSVPTLILHRSGSPVYRVEAGRYLASHIPGSRFVELPGDDFTFYFGDVDAVVDEVEEFLTGGRQGPEGEVITTTILFTDIVASTEQAAKMGHRKWTALSDAHDTMVRSVLERHRGREVKTVGDGFLATFDSTSRAVRAGTEIVKAAHSLGLEVRAGVHIGEVEVRPGDVVGVPVSIAKRVCDLARPGEVLASRPVTDLVVGSGIEFTERGDHELKGVPGSWKLFAVAR